ncbi:MAG: hypothetical protein QG670_1268 [Thermoproteota archaeon]|nr:hypothetical protein [Thermoproteota archaeon]
MIISKRENTKQFSTIAGVMNSILISGEKVMFLLVKMEPRSVIPIHSHPHEQMGICLEGKVEFQSGDKTFIVEPETVYVIPPNEKHGTKPIGKEKAVVLEVFSPPREDYLGIVASKPSIR